MQTIVITGANGRLGTALTRCAPAGAHCIPFVRHGQEGDYVPFELGKPVDWSAVVPPFSVIHCAYDFSVQGPTLVQEKNVAGSVAFLKSAAKAGASRILFVSSMAAFPGCKSVYGRGKLAVEGAVLALGGIVVRPGLIWGEVTSGIFGALLGLIQRFPIVPLVGSNRKDLYAAHEEDTARAIHELLRQPDPPQAAVTLASDRAWALREILELEARCVGRHVRFVRIPAWMVRWPLATLESIGLTPPFRSDSLVSLLNQNPDPDFTATRRLAVPFRDLGERSREAVHAIG